MSLSGTIALNKKDYYQALETAQRSMEITQWIIYFVEVILAAQQYAEDQLYFALRKTKFFDKYKNQLNGRQLKVIRRILEEGSKGFEGGINAGKYASLTSVAKATATRDLQYLLENGAIVLLGQAGGRSTKYQLNL